MTHFSRLAVVFSISLLSCVKAAPQSKNSGQLSGTSAQNSRSSSSDDSTSAGQQTKSGAATSIEAEALAYKALMANAEEIGDEIATALLRIPGRKTVVIISNPDVSNFLEWRTALGQIDLISNRAESIVYKGARRPDYEAVPATPVYVPTSTIPEELTSTQTAEQVFLALASAAAVNEGFTGVSGSTKDAPFVNMVARELMVRHIRVLAPNLYIPGLFSGFDLRQTIIFQRLANLDHLRDGLQQEVDATNQNLAESKKIVDGKVSTATPGDKELAQQYLLDGTTYLQRLINARNTIDKYSESLFTTTQSQSQTQRSTQPANTQSQDSASVNASKTDTNKTISMLNPSTVPFARLLSADFLANAMWSDVAPPANEPIDRTKVHVLVLQSLESGGAVITRGNLFTGKRLFFSGGVVNTFMLLDTDGAVECSGNVYEYEGFTKGDDLVRHLRRNDIDLNNQLIRVRSDCATGVIAEKGSSWISPDNEGQPPGSVQVITDPAGAMIIVDQADLSIKTPTVLKLNPGTHTITLQLIGHEEVSTAIKVQAGSSLVIKQTLKEEPEQ